MGYYTRLEILDMQTECKLSPEQLLEAGWSVRPLTGFSYKSDTDDITAFILWMGQESWRVNCYDGPSRAFYSDQFFHAEGVDVVRLAHQQIINKRKANNENR